MVIWGTPGGSVVKNASVNAGDTGSIPGPGISHISSVQSLSCVRLFATPWIAAHQATLSITISRSSLKLMSIESVMPSSHLILSHHLFLLPPIPPSIRVFYNESTLHMRWPKYWSFSFSIIPSKEHPGLISFRMDWLDLLEVQGTLKNLLQHHSSKAYRRAIKPMYHDYWACALELRNHDYWVHVLPLLLLLLSRFSRVWLCATP